MPVHTFLNEEIFYVKIINHYSRAYTQRQDLWSMLERNWNDFYWLTGETPNTLHELMTELKNIFHPLNESKKTSCRFQESG